ncbi:ABC1 kinase family protein [Ideonella livida]|uniref:Ubiquinone biosynthesis protein UbiB n=1 Tax=Ideonella livida TaxID=2707176 RepID=A0A7C9PF78_9BURK|nr:AarF/UbiB family protein [Ideonella livida]NDY90208.1 ubiquinone biosynthesis protein UbiB [Ideonella livida]
MLSDVLASTRDLGRLAEIAGILIRHGLGDAVRRLGLADALAAAGHTLHWPHAADLARLPPPVQLRRALEELGPTFVKFGQILAGRADLLPPETLHELEQLQTRVPALPLVELLPQLCEDLGGEPGTVFAHFDPQPLAAGSIAQVHRARLPDGTEVVVKIRRPGIEPVIEADLRLLERLAGLAEQRLPALAPYRPQALVREFGRSLRRELDLAQEGRHAERMAANLAPLGFVRIPRVHWPLTGPRLQVQEHIQGLSAQDVGALGAAGLDRRLLARRGAQAVLKMIVEDGFFHADPHPGNVIYLPGNQVAFIDFGMVGRLSARRRGELLDLLLGLVQREPERVAEVLMDWTGDASGARPAALEAEIEDFVDEHHGTPLAQLDLGRMLGQITQILRHHQLALPADLALLIKAFITLEGLGRALDPDFNMASAALPQLRRQLRAGYQPAALARQGWQGLLGLGRQLRRLPADLGRLLRRARHGRLAVAVEVPHLQTLGRQLDRAASRLSLALVTAALIIGSSIAMTVQGGPTLWGLPAFGLLGFLGAVMGGMWLLHAIARDGRRAETDTEPHGRPPDRFQD